MRLFKFSVLILLCVFLLSGCGYIQMREATSKCNDEETRPPMLCSIAEQFKVPLEVMGDGLIVLNSLAIGEGLYTVEQAREVVTELRNVIKGGVTWLVFKYELEKQMDKYPGLYTVAKPYADQMVDDTIMDPRDQVALDVYLGRIEKVLQG